MTSKEKFNYDSRRLQDNCNKVLKAIKVRKVRLEIWDMSTYPEITVSDSIEWRPMQELHATWGFQV